jgi:hypothetical protein
MSQKPSLRASEVLSLLGLLRGKGSEQFTVDSLQLNSLKAIDAKRQTTVNKETVNNEL